MSLAITAVNDKPTKVNLSSLTIDENAVATEIGTLSTDDLDTNDTFIYELVSGEGDTDNSLFTIETDKIKNTDAFDFETKSSYSIRIKSTDSGEASVERVFEISVINVNDIAITSIIEDTYCDGSEGIGSITVVVSQTDGDIIYDWVGPNGFSASEKDIAGLEAGTYTLTVKDDAFEKSFDLIVGKTAIYNDLAICYITSDIDDEKKNRIFLSYQGLYNGNKYEILREGSASGIFEKIGELNNGESSFLDTTSNNSSRSYEYRVRLVDNCGASSDDSPSHKTILLQSGIATDNSINLNWSSYQGLDYSTYVIYRSINNGDFEELASISSSNNSYNDTEADITQNSYSYYVSIFVTSCSNTIQSGSSQSSSSRNFNLASQSSNNSSEIKSNQKYIGAVYELPSELNFDELILGDEQVKSLLLENTGDGTLNIEGITMPEGYSIDQSIISVAARSSELLAITFTPVEAKSYEGVMAITSQNGVEEINLTGKGLLVTSIDDAYLDAEEVKVYPNPASDILSIDFSNSPAAVSNLRLVDMGGRLFWQRKAVREKQLTINVSNYQSGTYLLLIETSKGRLVKKIIINK